MRVNRVRGSVKIRFQALRQGVSGGARIRNRMVPADLRADSLAFVPPTLRRGEKILEGFYSGAAVDEAETSLRSQY
ncbi:hypothetical protein PoB_001174300 [Plakobranchus ocellatus]|uniref:Uncharacterized protein n=1 Tax=Plakobranchus ocellatus TaxID=259542 RepID=A0AAV3YSJ3_9GAST|nr:hypothetical protein PoB_001174300 [Plakobranchus ocellatus]